MNIYFTNIFLPKIKDGLTVSIFVKKERYLIRRKMKKVENESIWIINSKERFTNKTLKSYNKKYVK